MSDEIKVYVEPVGSGATQRARVSSLACLDGFGPTDAAALADLGTVLAGLLTRVRAMEQEAREGADHEPQ